MLRLGFAFLVGVHGLIHSFGLLKSFGWVKFERLSGNITRITGVAWGVAGLLFLLTAILISYGMESWWVLGLVSLLLSQSLIIGYWGEAKFGTALNGIIVLAVVVGFASWNFDRKVAEEIENVISGSQVEEKIPFPEERFEDLPEPVQKWLDKAGVSGNEKFKTVNLHQKGKIKLNPEQKNWSTVRAEQYINSINPGFIWKVDLKFASILPVAGRDKFIGGQGNMEIKLASLFPVVKENSNPKLDQSALQRYLAEIVWYPFVALSPYVEWETIDNPSSRAVMNYGGTSGSVDFHFSGSGKLERITALRYKDVDDTAKQKKWVGEVKGTKSFSGFTVPNKMDISWILEGKKFTWYKIDVTELTYA